MRGDPVITPSPSTKTRCLISLSWNNPFCTCADSAKSKVHALDFEYQILRERFGASATAHYHRTAAKPVSGFRRQRAASIASFDLLSWFGTADTLANPALLRVKLIHGRSAAMFLVSLFVCWEISSQQYTQISECGFWLELQAVSWLDTQQQTPSRHGPTKVDVTTVVHDAIAAVSRVLIRMNNNNTCTCISGHIQTLTVRS